MLQESANAVSLGSISVTWKDEGAAFEYGREGKRYRYDLRTHMAKELTGESKPKAGPAASEQPRSAQGRRNRPVGARQSTNSVSPDGQLTAFYRDHNLWLADTNGANEIAITQDGSEAKRIKYGAASWVYGEELDQRTAIWWSSNSQRIAFYRFDESQVHDYYLALEQAHLQSSVGTEAYPIAGTPNPKVDLLIYDVAGKEIRQVDVRDGQPFDDATIGHYIYGISWTADSRELLFHRTNRRQKVMEFCAADADSGKCRAIVREEWPASWVNNSPPVRFLADSKRFIWTSERTGWRNLYLYDLSGQLLAALTRQEFEVADVVHVDEKEGLVYYLARSGDNSMKLQLHRVHLDGQGDQRLTDPTFHHSIDFAPDGRHFIDVAQTHDTPPVTWLRDAQGKGVAELARSDLAKFKKLGLKPVELLKFKAADGQTDLYGLLHFPSNFRPYKKYPLLVSVYAGPETSGARETFALPNSLTELGFLVASFDSRSAGGRGKRFLDALYLKLGQIEIDDQAAGVRSLWWRRYVDKKRVGILGTSYGGFAAAMCLARYPEVFWAAAASSPVTDFRNYDTIYTERYLGLPQEHPAAYDATSLPLFADKFKGRLLLYYGTADDNVHPSNTLQFVQALQKAGKSFELQVGPDMGHGGMNRERMMEFFIDNLRR
jgi:dipeptidyl-peptidase 4